MKLVIEIQMIRIKRAYNPPADTDGYRVLVDRIWPRGVSKEEFQLDGWEKDLAPSTELRKWFAHDPKKWDEFQKRYREELKDKKDLLRELAGKSALTLVYGAKDEKHNNAAALKLILESL